MNGKALARMTGLIPNDYDLKVMAERFTAVLLKQMSTPFPFREFSNLLSEFTDKNKRSLAKFLNVKIKVPADRPFPDEQFVKLLRPRMTKSPEKSKVIQAIITNLMPLYEDIDELTSKRHLAAEKDLIKEFGPWHYYWSLRLFPFEDEEILRRLAELESELPDPVREESADSTPPESKTTGKKVKEEQKESTIIFRERELRQKAERETEAVRKDLRKLQKEYERLNILNGELKKEKEAQGRLVATYKEAYDKEHRRASTLEREKAELSGQLCKAQKTIEQLQESERILKAKLESETSRFQGEIAQLERELLSLKEQESGEVLVQKIVQVLNSSVDNLYTMLRGSQGSQHQEAIRKKISDALLLMNSLEAFFLSAEQPMRPAPAVSAPEQEPIHLLDSTIEAKEMFDFSEKQSQKRFLGTFYRRDHGGYVVLENNETFNIPESMVNSIGLEHEAEVSCEPQIRPDGTTSYYIRLLLQGDDSYAPIRQYMGYVKLGDHFTYYCVDMNNPENRFPIYEKDVEMQRPMDGDPCSFNVAIDGEYARLSKVFKRTEPLNTQETFLKAKSTGQAKSEKPASEPFLEGCKIVIVGGLAKWFESVVRETGAELIHDTGENPERIHSQLRRANALFLLLTANSHHATWSCIDIAKENRIPHFRIEGSKSNLRKQLWDNQHIIRGDHLKLKRA